MAENRREVLAETLAVASGAESPTGDSAAADYDVRDPMLGVLIDVQRGRLDNLGALYRIRRLVRGGWK